MITLLLLSLFITSCGNSSEDALDGGSSAAISGISIANSSRNLEWKSSYSKAIYTALDHENVSGILDAQIVAEDLKKIGCTNLNELSSEEKKIFYVVYFAAIAESESDYRTHIKTLNPGDMTTNVGLLQIDISAARNHTKRALGHLTENDLVNPVTNLKVGVFVLKNQILGKTAKNRLFPARSYYWSVLTYPSRMLKTVENNRENIPFCNS